MTNEAFVSFETAKLLDEAKAEFYDFMVYDDKGNFMPKGVYDDLGGTYKRFYAAPTLQVAMRWLREEYDILVDIGYDDLDWFWNIISISDEVPVAERPKLIKLGTACHKSYEEACEDGIQYCLKELIDR